MDNPFKTEQLSKIAELLRNKLEEARKQRMELCELYGLAFIAKTGLCPTECELVEETKDGKIVWYFRKRVDN
jgi:hypothetical protein